MQIISDSFNLIIFSPIVNALVFVLHGLGSLQIPGALGLSIIIVTAVIRLLMWPFISSQLKSAKKMAELKPHLEHLKAKHKEDKTALAAAQMSLYKEHGVSPTGGCVPILIQAVVLYSFYRVIYSLFSGQSGLDQLNSHLYLDSWHITTPPDPSFLGINLTFKPSDFSHLGVLLLLIPLTTALLSFIQSKMMTPKPLEVNSKDSKKEKKEKESTDEAMAAMQSQMVFMMPLMIGYFAFTLPIGIALYWNVSTIISIIQQYRLMGWGGFEDWMKRLGVGRE